MQYVEDKGSVYRIDKDGMELMANFVARITEETKYIDGLTTKTKLTINGIQKDMTKENEETYVNLPEIEIDSEDFAGLSWVMPNWGVRCLIRPGTGLRDDLRTAIQSMSMPKQSTVFRHIGWTTIGNKPAYLHANGAIRAGGNDKSVRVELPSELRRYQLNTESDVREAARATIALTELTIPEVSWCLLAGCLTPLFGAVDFATHVSGRTGTFKSEIMSLYQSHYGDMDARHLPGSWSSTANALEALSFFAKNAAFVIDDFVPTGTSWQVRGYQQNADKIIRAQGNQAGRARLTDVSSLQTTMYPRGIIMSTGEDTPEGHSVRGRMMILELSPDDVKPANLTKAQKNRALYSRTVSGMAQQLAKEPYDIATQVDRLRPKYLKVGHTRTPTMMARMIATIEYFLEWCVVIEAISESQRAKYMKEATKAIESAGGKQQMYLEDADPVDQFTAAIRQTLAVGGGHIRTLNGGIPTGATMLGWTAEKSNGELPNYKARGQTIGWIKWDEDALYIDVTVGYAVVKKSAGAELTLTKNTLFKRMKDSGALTRVDDGRQRNTVRVQAEGHPRQVLALSASAVLQTKEIPSDE